MFYKKLDAIYPYLTASETKIVNYILMNRETAPNLTSQKMADILGVGQSTVIRFSQKMGYKSYRNMLLELEQSDAFKGKLEEIQITDSTQTTNEKIKSHVQMLLDLTVELNNGSEFDRAVDLIRDAGIIFCYGFGSTSSAASHIHELLQLFGLNAFCLDDFGTMMSMRNHGSDGLLIVFSKSGETPMTNRVVQYAKERGLKILGVTSMAPNAMVPYLDVWLKTMHSKVHTRFLHYTETLPMFYIVDCLILNLYKTTDTKYSDAVYEHRRITKGVRIVPPPHDKESEETDPPLPD